MPWGANESEGNIQRYRGKPAEYRAVVVNVK